MTEIMIIPELLPVLKQLQQEGFRVYSYMPYNSSTIRSLFWYENGRVLDVQPHTWYNEKYNRDCFRLSTCYHPSVKNGSGCGLSDDDEPVRAEDVLKRRHYPTWVRGYVNYKSIDEFLNKRGLKFFELESPKVNPLSEL